MTPSLVLLLVVAMAIQAYFGLRPLRLLRRKVVAVRRGQAEAVSGLFPREVAPLIAPSIGRSAADQMKVERD